MLTLDQCKKLKDMGMEIPREPRGYIYWFASDGELMFTDYDSHPYLNIRDEDIYCPDTRELLDFAVEVANQKYKSDLMIVGLFWNLKEWVTQVDWSQDDPRSGIQCFDPDPDQALFKLIERMYNQKPKE